jgi:hypothetical protein
MSELDGLMADLRWMRKSMEDHDKVLAEMFERVRAIEMELAAIRANQKPPINGWALFFGIVAAIGGILFVLDRIYVNQ